MLNTKDLICLFLGSNQPTQVLAGGDDPVGPREGLVEGSYGAAALPQGTALGLGFVMNSIYNFCKHEAFNSVDAVTRRRAWISSLTRADRSC